MSSDSMFKTTVTTEAVSEEGIKELGKALEESAKTLEEKYAYVDQLIESIVSGELNPDLGRLEMNQAMLKELMAFNYNMSINRALLGLQIGLVVNAQKPEELDKD